ncbi:MAG: RNA polymerase sigma factor [Firmicutes bacterium]|jgi:RNA polymerase sigma-70 factor (ECF subfamily)|nr:RNA polymerase sigma factor [Bacillota bacterium]
MMRESAVLKNQTDTWAAELWPRLYRFFYFKVQNREEAEELTQDTLDRVYRKIKTGSINGEEKIEAYTFAAARNLLTDLWRKRGRQFGSVSMDELREKGWDIPHEPREVEEKMIIQEAMKQLSPEHRRVLTLRIIEGWPVESVAVKMKRSPGAVRSLQFRAVRALKEILEKGGYFHE